MLPKRPPIRRSTLDVQRWTFQHFLFPHTKILAALAASLLTACSPSPTSAPSQPTASTAPPADPNAPGLVWRIEGGKAPVFLAGSFHFLRPEDYPLPQPYETAWAASTHIVMETAPGESSQPAVQAALQPLLILPSGTLQDRLTPATWQDLTTWSTNTSTPLATLQTQPPWLAALTIAVTGTRHLGYRREHGIEAHFTARLTGSGKTAGGLETVLSQMSIFGQLPADTQEAMLRQSLTDAATLPQKAALLTQAWRAGDDVTLHNTLSASFKDFPTLQKLILHDRNQAWLPQIQAHLQSGRPTLIFIGAAHLCGPHSLIQLLQAKGHLTTRLLPAKVSAVPTKKAA